MTEEIAVSHHEYVSARTFDEVVATFESVVSTVEDGGIGPIISAARDSKDFEARVAAKMGSSGFVRFLTIDHGAWLALYGIAAKARTYTIGNPVIALTMLQHNIAAGLNVPVRVMIYEHPESRSVRFVFDQPSSLMSNIQSAGLAEAARKLDAKLAALAQLVTA